MFRKAVIETVEFRQRNKPVTELFSMHSFLIKL